MKTPYRTDRDALEERLATLLGELAAARGAVAELVGAAAQVSGIERAIAEVHEQLARTRRLPMLDSIRIASPCEVPWDSMVGDDRQRQCAQCDRTVYDLSTMTRAEAEALLSANDELPCVSLWRRADGTVITADCPVGRRRVRLRRVVAATVGGGLLAAGALMMRWRTTPPACTLSTPPVAPQTAEFASPPPAATQTAGLPTLEPPVQMLGEPVMPVRGRPLRTAGKPSKPLTR